MSNTIKTTKNTIKLGGKTYCSMIYLKNNKKDFKKDDFIVMGSTSYYLPI